MKVSKGCIPVSTVLFFAVFNWQQTLVASWTNEEFEMFDLVEELNSMNFYEFLGVSSDATVKEIKSSYRQLSVKHHPDKNPDDPNASLKFRQLVGVYEVLKDDELRKSYQQVLEFGLPNWRQPMFYFRRARKLALWHVGLILLVIVSTGQYLAAWGSYFERKLSLNEIVEFKIRKAQRSKKALKDGSKVQEQMTAELEQLLQKPSLWDTAPIQLIRLGKYLIFNLPFDVRDYYRQQREDRETLEMELLEQRLQEEEDAKILQEPKKPRKRKVFAIPEKEVTEDSVEQAEAEDIKEVPKQEFISGGLWTDDDIAYLIKLCTKYPGGFPDRWNHISNLMERPVGEVTHMAKRVLEDLTKRSEEEEDHAPVIKSKVKTKGSKVDDSLAEKVALWTKDEQKRLEMALQMYPKGGSADRWAKISSHVGKSKEECMQRFKYVAELVKKKREKVECGDTVVANEEASSVESSNDKEISNPSSKQPQKIENVVAKKETVERQNSSSSNNSASDNNENEWCIVDKPNGS